MLQQTSLKAFEEIIPSLNNRQKQVYELLRQVGHPLNNLMISKYLSLPINQVTPRILELRQKGLVLFAYLQKCPYTNHVSIFWRINLNRGQNELI
jgi:hypothetical protein